MEFGWLARVAIGPEDEPENEERSNKLFVTDQLNFLRNPGQKYFICFYNIKTLFKTNYECKVVYDTL